MPMRRLLSILVPMLLVSACAQSQCYDCYGGERESVMRAADQISRRLGEAAGRGDFNGSYRVQPYFILRPLYLSWLNSLLRR